MALLAAWKPEDRQNERGNSAKKRPRDMNINPETEPENEAGRRPADTPAPGRRFADAPRFAIPDQPGRWPKALAPGRAKSAADPDFLAACVPPDTPFPRRRANGLSLPPPWPRVPPASGLTTATTASPSGCVVAVCPPEKQRRFCRNRHAVRDWNKTPAVRGRPLWRNQKDRSRRENCGGSKTPRSRSGGSAAV